MFKLGIKSQSGVTKLTNQRGNATLSFGEMAFSKTDVHRQPRRKMRALDAVGESL
jgi:hypothetical protein